MSNKISTGDLRTLAEDLVASALATRRSEAVLVRAQASLLAWLSAGDRLDRCGFSALSSLALEVLGMPARTVRERLALDRLCSRWPEIERALLEGRLSICQALALGPILSASEPDSGETVRRWIEIASGVSVRALRYEARAQRASRPAGSGGGGGQGSSGQDSEDGVDQPGRTISFPAPAGFQVAFDRTMELARKQIGRDAPIHECIEAVLAETGWAGLGPAPRDFRSLQPPPGIAVCPPPEVAVPGDPVREVPVGEVPVREILVAEEAVRHARATLRQAASYLEEIDELIETGEPRSPHDALARLQQIQLLRAPARILLAHIIRDLRRTYAMDLLGYGSMADLVEHRLRLSERSARHRVAESLLFEDDAALEEAVGRGEISLMQAHLIARLSRGAGQERFVERARQVTWRQFQREFRVLELLRRCGLDRPGREPLGSQASDAVESALIEALGGDRAAIEAELRRQGIPPVPPGSPADPAENRIVMERLEALVEMLALTLWDEFPGRGLPDRQTFAASERGGCIRFWAPEAVAEDFLHVVSRYRRECRPFLSTWAAVAFLLAEATREWQRQDPERQPVRARILERDRHRCVVPGCARRSQLEDHHITFRSRGGGEEDGNRATLCHTHHAHGVHKGYVRISGHAPHALRFDLGVRPHGSPVLALRGEKVLRPGRKPYPRPGPIWYPKATKQNLREEYVGTALTERGVAG